ncbi:MAG: hypothetical protein ACUVS2_10775 [Candidatus Flexifilum sp.]
MSSARVGFFGWVRPFHRLTALLLIALLLAACNSRRGLRPDDLPTPADLNALATALPLTENAPPAPYTAGTDDFALIDNGLTELPGWRYVVQFQFDGVFSDSGAATRAVAAAEVSFNQVASARRVTFTTQGELIGQTEDSAYEAVRLGPDAFLVREGICLTGAGADAAAAADLRAGELVGGVSLAVPAGRRAVINGETVYAFRFEPAAFQLPAIRLDEGGALTIDSAELWIAPARRAVIRFYANLTVTRALLFDRARPVNGTILLRYDLYDIGTAFNITVPFGC